MSTFAVQLYLSAISKTLESLETNSESQKKLKEKLLAANSDLDIFHAITEAKSAGLNDEFDVLAYYIRESYPSGQAARVLTRKGLGAKPPFLNIDENQVPTVPVQEVIEKVEQQQVAQEADQPLPVTFEKSSITAKDCFEMMYPMATYQVSNKTAGELFGATLSANRVVPVRHYPDDTPQIVLDAIPEIDPDYTFEDDIHDVLNVFLGPQGRVFNTYGPMGCGKSELFTQVCARMRIPLFEIHCTKETKPTKMIGKAIPLILNGGITYAYELGPVLLAYRYNGVCNADEIDMLEPQHANVLHRPMEAKPIPITELQTLMKPGPDFRFVCTSNTSLSGDNSGSFSGTKRQNAAFRSRIESTKKGYLPVWKEYQLLLKRAPKLNPAAAPTPEVAKGLKKLGVAMCEFAEATRVAYTSGAISTVMTTRQMKWWGVRTEQNFKLEGKVHVTDALMVTLINSVPKRSISATGTSQKDETEELLKMWEIYCPSNLTAQYRDLQAQKAKKISEDTKNWNDFKTIP